MKPTKSRTKKVKAWAAKVTVWVAYGIDGGTTVTLIGKGIPDWLSAGSFVQITPLPRSRKQ